jgi:hypothetical protein
MWKHGPFSANSEEEAKAWMFAYATKALVLNRRLSATHWVNQWALFGGDEEEGASVDVEVVGESARKTFEGYVYADVVLCDHVRLRAGGVTVEVREAFATGVDGEGHIFVPHGAASGNEVLQQLSSYYDDWNFLEDDLDEDARALSLQVDVMRTPDPVERLRMQLEEALWDHHDLRGLRCQITINDTGKVELADVVKAVEA